MNCLIVLLAFVPLGDAKLNLSHSTSFVVFAGDCNANPSMCFGGKILSEMDRCAGITTRRLLYHSKAQDAVTVAIDDVRFYKPAQVKDLVYVTGKVTKASGKSVTVLVTVEKEIKGEREKLVEGIFVFCAYDLDARAAIEHGIVYREN